MVSVHDVTIKQLSYDGNTRIALLRGYSEDKKKIDILFQDTIAVDFFNVLEGNIIFDIEQIELGEFKRKEPTCYEHWKQHGWPLHKGKHVFVLSSSYGLEAYVLADRMETIIS